MGGKGISVSYNDLQLVVIMLFGFIGIFRGWLKELFTSFLLVLMALPLFYPEMAKAIIDLVNRLFAIFMKLLAVLTNGTVVQAAAVEEAESYKLFVIILAILVVLSYTSDRIGFAEQKLTAFSALLGGIIGAFNGFLALSLAKDYVLGNFFTGGAEIQAAAMVSDLSLSIGDVPTGPSFGDVRAYFPIMILAVLFVVLFGRFFKLQSPLKKK